MLPGLDILILVVVKMLDPMAIVVAVIIGWLASLPSAASVRWGFAIVGAAIQGIAFHAIICTILSACGQAFTTTRGFTSLLGAVVAAFLQIAIVLGVARWIKRNWGAGSPASQ
jgi:hypothetical protein